MVELPAAQALSPGRKVAREDQEPLIATQSVGQPVDQRGGVALGVVGVVDDERAAFRFERRERGFDRIVGVVTGAGHSRCGCLEAGLSDTRPKPGGEQCRAPSALVQRHLDLDGAPGVHDLGGQCRLAITATCLDDHDPLRRHRVREPRSRDVVGGKGPHSLSASRART